MFSARLKIDTSIGGSASSAKVSSIDRNVTPASTRSKLSFGLNAGGKRQRTTSNASSSSSLSIISPMTSSTNASTSSLQLPYGEASGLASVPSPSSPSLDETVRLASEYVLAMHDFAPQQQNATCLSFRAGQVIHVLNRDSSGWWDGELEGRRGWFPSNYVNADLNSLTEEEEPLDIPVRVIYHPQFITQRSPN